MAKSGVVPAPCHRKKLYRVSEPCTTFAGAATVCTELSAHHTETGAGMSTESTVIVPLGTPVANSIPTLNWWTQFATTVRGPSIVTVVDADGETRSPDQPPNTYLS